MDAQLLKVLLSVAKLNKQKRRKSNIKDLRHPTFRAKPSEEQNTCIVMKNISMDKYRLLCIFSLCTFELSVTCTFAVSNMGEENTHLPASISPGTHKGDSPET